jgi:hypothetical protein
MSIVNGYVHHCLYILMVHNLLQRRLESVLVLMGILELPTLILSLGAISPTVRSDLLFGFLFFVTRLGLHGTLIWHLWVRAWVGRRLWVYPALVLPLHCLWFRDWCRQMARKSLGREKDRTVRVRDYVRVRGKQVVDSVRRRGLRSRKKEKESEERVGEEVEIESFSWGTLVVGGIILVSFFVFYFYI